MNYRCFWLTDKQFETIARHLPTGSRGKPRADDRKVINGIVHALNSGKRWPDSPTMISATMPMA